MDHGMYGITIDLNKATKPNAYDHYRQEKSKTHVKTHQKIKYKLNKKNSRQK